MEVPEVKPPNEARGMSSEAIRITQDVRTPISLFYGLFNSVKTRLSVAIS
jgi:hypothetical protein